jgi:peptidoglycan/LPS O-acetylase OafA/YrhL
MEVFPKKKPHLEPLTSIRFVAAFHVVVYHGAPFLEPSLGEGAGLVKNLIHTGYTGVNLFFLLSGFILAYTYLDPDQPSRVDRRRFWIARFARIYPLYALSLLIVAPRVVGHFLATNDAAGAAAKIGVSGVSALALLQAWIPPLRPIWNFPSWTLSVEAFFYLLFPFVVPWLWRLRPGQALAAGASFWVLGLLPAGIAVATLPAESAWTPATGILPASPLLTFLTGVPLLRLHEFVLGIALARAFVPGTAPESSRLVRLAPTLALISALAIGGLIAFADRIPRLLVHAGLFDPVYGVLVVSLAHSRGWLRRSLSLRPWVILGEVSYGVYVLHIPVMIWLSLATGITGEGGAPGFFALYSALLVALATASYFLFEEPVRLGIRSRFSAGVRALQRSQQPGAG